MKVSLGVLLLSIVLLGATAGTELFIHVTDAGGPWTWDENATPGDLVMGTLAITLPGRNLTLDVEAGSIMVVHGGQTTPERAAPKRQPLAPVTLEGGDASKRVHALFQHYGDADPSSFDPDGPPVHAQVMRTTGPATGEAVALVYRPDGTSSITIQIDGYHRFDLHPVRGGDL